MGYQSFLFLACVYNHIYYIVIVVIIRFNCIMTTVKFFVFPHWKKVINRFSLLLIVKMEIHEEQNPALEEGGVVEIQSDDLGLEESPEESVAVSGAQESGATSAVGHRHHRGYVRPAPLPPSHRLRKLQDQRRPRQRIDSGSNKRNKVASIGAGILVSLYTLSHIVNIPYKISI